MPRGLDDAKQQAFIDQYENLLNTMGADEAVVFVDAVHPTHQVRPAGCWARKDIAIAVEQTTGRDRLNIHGAIDLETGQTQILAVETVSALSFIKLLGEIEGTHTAMRLIHVFVDNASYHKAGIVKEWLAAAGRKIVLHFLPPYCPHLDPIERLWALMPLPGARGRFSRVPTGRLRCPRSRSTPRSREARTSFTSTSAVLRPPSGAGCPRSLPRCRSAPGRASASPSQACRAAFVLTAAVRIEWFPSAGLRSAVGRRSRARNRLVEALAPRLCAVAIQ